MTTVVDTSPLSHCESVVTDDGPHKCGPSLVEVTPLQLSILQHSIGADRFGRRTGDRSHFVTDATSFDGAVCQSLVTLGLMEDYGPQTILGGGMNLYRVNRAGREVVSRQSAKPPKLSRSKLRYESFLDWKDATQGTFREFLKTEHARV